MEFSISNEMLERTLAWRYATQLFDPARKISDRDWSTLEAALVGSPSSFGLQPWRFVLVADPELRSKLRERSWDQPQVTDASHFVVLAAKRKITPDDVEEHLQHMASIRALSGHELEGHRQSLLSFINNTRMDHEEWATRQVYLALGMLLSSAAMLRIDACPMEGLDPDHYDRVLGLDALGASTKVACALGYRAESDAWATAPKVRFPASHIVIVR
jgi:nitroreductase